MKFGFFTGALYFLSAVALMATPLDDKIKTFETALKAAPQVKKDPTIGDMPYGRILTVVDLDRIVEQTGNLANLEDVVSRLMATYPSSEVQKTGGDLVQELETQRKLRTDAFETKANIDLAKVQDVLNQAKQASDLDQTLKDLQALQNSQIGSPAVDVSPALVGKINETFQFVTQWQDYLAAKNSGNMQQTQNSLRNILDNRQIDAPSFFPRSEILAKMAEASGGNSNVVDAVAPPTVTDPDIILARIKGPDDFAKMLPELLKIPGPNPQTPWDWSALIILDKARLDAVAGLPVTLNVTKAVDEGMWGGEFSRIIAMELINLLPYYFETEVSDPPKADETVIRYLDRLSTSADASGDLALLQRVLAMKVAFSEPERNFLSTGTQQFLGGLSQDAAGQYAPAVVSYENALKNPDGFLSVKIVGERLAAIKAAYPEDFERGLTTFMTPPPIDSYLGGYPPRRPNFPGYPDGRIVSILPIPITISIPVRTSPSTSTNVTPVNPSSPAVTK